jgi:3-hydroxyacyl-CoA dehydrogenase
MTGAGRDRVAVIGSGAIGASWAALFAAHGFTVVASDPRPEAEAGLAEAVGRFWPSLERLGLVAERASPSLVSFVTDPAEACQGAVLVQENAPEDVEVKRALYAVLDEAAEADAVIASSSSTMKPTDLQAACSVDPGRVVVGHPFNPPHLIPLVEVVGGAHTRPEVIEAAMGFYRACGKTPVHIRAELTGHVTNRLQAALWREAYWLVEQGVVSVADVDLAISSGPGLRWSLLGPFATQHFSGGPGGIGHILSHLGPPTAELWSSLEAPVFDEALCAKIVDGMADELAGLDEAAVRAERDRLLEDLLLAKAGAEHLPGPVADRAGPSKGNEDA